jgi:hypothetical protein
MCSIVLIKNIVGIYICLILKDTSMEYGLILKEDRFDD